MDLGTCPACHRPYTAADVAGLGILRARPAPQGGPVVEYRCAGCGRVIVLVPHGEGRYAPPGAPPPSTVPVEARRPAWVDRDGQPRRRPAPAPPTQPPATGPAAPAPPRSPGPEVPPAPPADAERAPTLWEALELLRVAPTASREELERAYRTRSLGCHPDKVAHLDPEFQALAERKFKRLRAAYELLGGS